MDVNTVRYLYIPLYNSYRRRVTPGFLLRAQNLKTKLNLSQPVAARDDFNKWGSKCNR